MAGYFTHTVGGMSCSQSLAPALTRKDLGSGVRVRIRADWETKWPGPERWVKTGERKIYEQRGLLITMCFWHSAHHPLIQCREIECFLGLLNVDPPTVDHASLRLSYWNSLPILKDKSFYLHEKLWVIAEGWSHV